MKMMRRTRKMSVSGVMLISAKTPSPPSPSASGTLPIPMVSGRLPARFARGWSRVKSRQTLSQKLDELVGQQPQLGGDPGQAGLKVVVENHCLDGDQNADRSGDQRL